MCNTFSTKENKKLYEKGTKIHHILHGSTVISHDDINPER